MKDQRHLFAIFLRANRPDTLSSDFRFRSHPLAALLQIFAKHPDNQNILQLAINFCFIKNQFYLAPTVDPIRYSYQNKYIYVRILL